MGLTCQQLTCRRGRNTLFAGVSFSLQAGEALWVQGRNGSGKTTLLRSFAGSPCPTAAPCIGKANLSFRHAPTTIPICFTSATRTV